MASTGEMERATDWLLFFFPQAVTMHNWSSSNAHTWETKSPLELEFGQKTWSWVELCKAVVTTSVPVDLTLCRDQWSHIYTKRTGRSKKPWFEFVHCSMMFVRSKTGHPTQHIFAYLVTWHVALTLSYYLQKKRETSRVETFFLRILWYLLYLWSYVPRWFILIQLFTLTHPVSYRRQN